MARITELVHVFCTLLRTHQGEHLDAWLGRTRSRTFLNCARLRKACGTDYEAVKAGLRVNWRQGLTEGQIHRLKLLKRQMYGRASFQTLRQRVLHRAYCQAES